METYENDDMEQNFPTCSFCKVETTIDTMSKRKKNKQPFLKLKTSLSIVS